MGSEMCIRDRMMDVRHPLQPFDNQMLNWALAAGMPVHILLTKADKLKKGPANNALLKVRAALREHDDLVSVQLFSALKHSGHAELFEVLTAWLTDHSVLEEAWTPGGSWTGADNGTSRHKKPGYLPEGG